MQIGDVFPATRAEADTLVADPPGHVKGDLERVSTGRLKAESFAHPCDPTVHAGRKAGQSVVTLQFARAKEKRRSLPTGVSNLGAAQIAAPTADKI